MGFTELLRARAVFIKSFKVLGWQRGAPKSREYDFPKKKRHFFLNFIGPVTPPWVLHPSKIMLMGFTELLRARAVFIRSIKVLGWQRGAPKTREQGLPRKRTFFLIFIGLVTPLWVLYPSEIKHIGSKRPLIARAVFASSIKVLELQPGAPKTREHDFPKKNLLIL